ncbi:MAG: hypothetical protein ACPGXI_10960 [Mycobacterium sp.]
MEIGASTHTVYYAGVKFHVAHEQAVGVAQAMANARTGAVEFVSLPSTNADTGETVAHHLLIGPGTPCLIEGPPLLHELVM